MKRILVLFAALLLPAIAGATVTSTASTAPFTCSNSTGPFPFTFPALNVAAIQVVEHNPADADGVITVIDPSQWTGTPVNNSYANGGSITLVTACPTGYILTIARVTETTQLTQYTPYMPALYANVEGNVDQLSTSGQDILREDQLHIGSVTGQGTATVTQTPLGQYINLGFPGPGGPFCPLTGCTMTGPLIGTSATFSLSVDSPLLKLTGVSGVWGQILGANGTGTVFLPSPVFSQTIANVSGDSIFNCVGVTVLANCVREKLRVDYGGLNEYEVSGSYLEDMDWQLYLAVNPQQSGNHITFLLGGTNNAFRDLDTNGAQTVGRQANATHALLSGAAWAGIAQPFKLSGANYLTAGCSITGGTGETSNYSYVTTVALTSVGATLHCPNTLQSGTAAMIFNHLASSNGAATATLSIDGVLVDTLHNTGFNGKSIGTTNNPNLVIPIAESYTPTGGGSHSFDLTCTAGCTAQGGITGGIFIGGATAASTPGDGAFCVITFSNGGTATVPVSPNGSIIAPRIALTITSPGSPIVGNTPTTGTIANGSTPPTITNCNGTPQVLTWTDGPFVFAWEASPIPNNAVNLGGHAINPPNAILGGTILAQQSGVFGDGHTGAEMNPYANIYNNIVKSVSDQLMAAGVYAPYMDPRKCVNLDYLTLDASMQAATLPDGTVTLNSTNPPLHPNDYGSTQLATCFENIALPNLASATVAQTTTQRTVSASTTMLCSDNSVYQTGGSTTLTLPDPSTCPAGRRYTYYHQVGTRDSLITADGNAIKGFPTDNLMNPYTEYTFEDQGGANWYLFNSRGIGPVITANSGSVNCAADGQTLALSATAVLALSSVAQGTDQIGRSCNVVNQGVTDIAVTGTLNNFVSPIHPGQTVKVTLVTALTPTWTASNWGVIGGSVLAAPGTYGDATHVNQIVVDSNYRVASITPVAITVPAPTPIYTYDTCTAGNCANLSANQGAQTMVGSVPGSNGAYYTFKGDLTQTTTGTSCSANSVKLQITFTDPDTNAVATSDVSIQTGATAAPNLTCTASTGATLIKCRFNYQIVAKSGTAISWNTASYTATSCSPNWTYTVRPLLVQDYQMQ